MLTRAQILGLDERLLVDCGNGHKLLPDVHDAFQQLQQAAKHDGVDIQLVSSYRNFARQLLIWNQKWQGQRPLYSIDGRQLDTDTLSKQEKLQAILTFSALPGASRHHWGTDMDVYDKAGVEKQQHQFKLVESEYQLDGPCYQLHCWLTERAEGFGFYRPYSTYNGGVAVEPWHLSYRPIAKQVIADLHLDDIAAQIRATEIAGKDVILANLEQIFTQYTLNGENPEATE